MLAEDTITFERVKVLGPKDISLSNSRGNTSRTIPIFIALGIAVGVAIGGNRLVNLLNYLPKWHLIETLRSLSHSKALYLALGVILGILLLNFFVSRFVIYKMKLKRCVRARADHLQQVIIESDGVIRKVEDHLTRCLIRLSPAGLDAMSQARRIVQGLEGRLEEIRYLLQRGGFWSLEYAETLSNSALILSENRLDSLISYKPTPPILSEDIVPSLYEAFATIKNDLRKVA